jgi:cobalt-zinc-cadmium efflux system outer membrane protein
MNCIKVIIGAMVCAVALSGCATLDLRSGFSEVSSTVQQRVGTPLFWNNGTDLDREAEDKLKAILGEKLTAERAVQIALLNNRELQGVYADLGVAQADLVQAGLLKNPLFDAVVTFPVSGGRPNFELTAVMSFLDVFYLPLRKRVAAGRFEEAKTRVTGAVLDLAGKVRSAVFEHLANEQLLELDQSIVQALAASLEVAQRLRQAGNISDLDFARERVLLEGAKLRLRSAEISSRQSREQLNILMGLWGEETEWQDEGRLPDIPKDVISLEGGERTAVEESLDLAAQRQRIIAAGNQLGLNRATALVADLDVGARGERGDGPWAVGPVLQFPIPLFDQGQARTGRAAAELGRAQQEYYALAVRLRATARAVADRLQGSRDRALFYRDVVLPLQELVVNEAQLHYNSMQLGPIELLRAREQQIQAATAYVGALRDYWVAYGDYQQLMSGRLPQSSGTSRSATSMAPAAAIGAGH